MKPISRAVRFLLVVGVVLLFAAPLTSAETETETQSQSGSTFSYSQQSLQFAMVSVPVPGDPSYPQGNGSAEVQAQGGYVSVHFDAEGVAKGARLMLVLMASGVSHSVSNMTASYDGEVEAEGFVSLAPGTYSLAVQVLDTSSFSTPAVVLAGSPATQTLNLPQGSQESSTTTAVVTQVGSTVQEGESEDGYIRTAIQTRQIPAVVEVADSGSNAVVIDGNFSVSVGRYHHEGYLVSIFGGNVTGSRVLMLNMTSSQARALFSHPVQVTLDGEPVPQASALSQVLGTGTGASARFILLSSVSALKLLVLIPHFSYHVIAIVPAIVQAGEALLVYVPAVLIAVAAVSVVFLGVYSRRTRIAG